MSALMNEIIPKATRDPLPVYVQYERYNIAMMFKGMIDDVTSYPEQLASILGRQIHLETSYSLFSTEEVALKLIERLTLWQTRSSDGDIFPFGRLIADLDCLIQDTTVQNYLYALDEFVYTDNYILRIYDERYLA